MSTQNASDPHAWKTIEELCERHVGALPAPSVLEVLKKSESRRPEVRDFIERVFRLAGIACLRAADITAFDAMGIDLLPSVLPGAWGGAPPPVTAANRHARINTYLGSNPWFTPGKGTVLLDMGCGFPPVTAVDAAVSFPDWQVVGADPCLDEYLVYDPHGNYACMDDGGNVRFFSAGPANAAEYLALMHDRQATLKRFHDLFLSLKGLLPDSKEHATVELNGAKLVHHPLRTYERPNLSFIKMGVGADAPQADIIRCFNVLMYFDRDFREKAEAWALRTLRPGGIFICGFNGPGGTHARYTVYWREGDGLVAKEFAFAIETVRSFGVVWFAMHENDREAWSAAKLVGILRSDEVFRKAHDEYLDRFLEEERLLRRQPDGFLGMVPNPRPLHEAMPVYQKLLRTLEGEFSPRAVDALRRAGFDAWVNSIGDVAVKP